MSKRPTIAVIATLTMGILLSAVPLAGAQPATTPASNSKEARKEKRKAARAQKNKALKELQENNYQRGGPSYAKPASE